MQTVVVPPRLDVVLPHQIQGADQFHSLKIRAVQLWHHGLYLRSVQHPHENGFNDIVIVVAECDFVAAKLPCEAVQMASAHPGAQITGGFLHVVYGVKDIRLENRNGNV